MILHNAVMSYHMIYIIHFTQYLMARSWSLSRESRCPSWLLTSNMMGMVFGYFAANSSACFSITEPETIRQHMMGKCKIRFQIIHPKTKRLFALLFWFTMNQPAQWNSNVKSTTIIQPPDNLMVIPHYFNIYACFIINF